MNIEGFFYLNRVGLYWFAGSHDLHFSIVLRCEVRVVRNWYEKHGEQRIEGIPGQVGY